MQRTNRRNFGSRLAVTGLAVSALSVGLVAAPAVTGQAEAHAGTPESCADVIAAVGGKGAGLGCGSDYDQ